jgi:hypothetical protein
MMQPVVRQDEASAAAIIAGEQCDLRATPDKCPRVAVS